MTLISHHFIHFILSNVELKKKMSAIARIFVSSKLSSWNCRRIGEATLPWAIFFFFEWEETKYFSPYAYCSIFKSDLINLNFIETNLYFILFILFILGSYFFDEQSEVLDIRFYWNKKGYTSIHLRTKIVITLSVIGVKFPKEKKKKFVVNKIL